MIEIEKFENDKAVYSWDELNKELFDSEKNRFGRFRSNYVFRGMADSSWPLKTSLMRLGGDYWKVEKPLLRSFKKYAESNSPNLEDFWLKMSVAQHHGLPTRVLDWTSSPLIAAHFATTEKEHHDKDGVIWSVDVVEARKLLPKSLGEILMKEYAFLYSVEMLRNIQSIEELENIGKINGDFLLFFEPPSLDARIVNQAAILSVMPNPQTLVSEYLKQHPELFRRIIIPKKIKKEIRDKLDQANVTERMLMPGLDGLCQWLKRYYETW